MSTTQVAVEDAAAQPEVAALTDDTRREIVELREGGLTLSELKARYPQLTSDQIRDVLPPGNARERKAREAKQPKATQPKQAKEKAQPEPKPSRYVEDLKVVRALAERLMSARAAGVGQAKIAAEADVMPFAVWRAERRLKVTADELPKLTAALDRIETWEKVPKAAKVASPSKAEIQHRVETTIEFLRTGIKGLSGRAVADGVLAILDPKQADRS
jgi:ribosome-binding protein aMBF1 (putative translation factor)